MRCAALSARTWSSSSRATRVLLPPRARSWGCARGSRRAAVRRLSGGPRHRVPGTAPASSAPAATASRRRARPGVRARSHGRRPPGRSRTAGSTRQGSVPVPAAARRGGAVRPWPDPRFPWLRQSCPTRSRSPRLSPQAGPSRRRAARRALSRCRIRPDRAGLPRPRIAARRRPRPGL
jgi:hypothetical protein